MRKIALLTEYDGTNYAGWQWQKNAPSIQQVITKYLSKICKEDISLHGCSRTDAGVHARGHVSHFITTCQIPADKIPLALNSFLPLDVVCKSACEVDLDFHSRFLARGKKYSYTFCLDALRSAFYYQHTLHLPALKNQLLALNTHEFAERWKNLIDAMRTLLGEHDFLSFQASGAQTKTSVRCLYSYQVDFLDARQLLLFSWRVEDIAGIKESFIDTVNFNFDKIGLFAQDEFARVSFLRFSVKGNGFLYNMVRILTGTLLEILKGTRQVSSIQDLLLEPNRRLAGVTLPARGLCLEKVYYDEQLFNLK